MHARETAWASATLNRIHRVPFGHLPNTRETEFLLLLNDMPDTVSSSPTEDAGRRSPSDRMVLGEIDTNVDVADRRKSDQEKQTRIKNGTEENVSADLDVSSYFLDDECFDSWEEEGVPEGKTETRRVEGGEKAGKKSEGNVEVDRMDDDSFEDWIAEDALDLSTMQKCRVVSVERQPRCMTLKVENVENTLRNTVQCFGLWQNERVRENDTVSIEAVKQNGQWVVNNDEGLLVVRPDTLVSSTIVATSIFCKRRTVLAEKFRKIEALPTAKGDAGPLLLGQFIHRVFQMMTEEDTEPIEARLRKICKKLQSSNQMIFDLYAYEITAEEFQEKIDPYLENIKDFFRYYIEGQKVRNFEANFDNYRGKISSIRDVEENLWVPKLGLKGRIDLTVEIEDGSGQQIIPLELKTGKPTLSVEHKAQVILYVLMMSSANISTSKGLISYLSANIVKELNGTRAETRDLIMLRNSLAYYLSPNRTTDIEDIVTDSTKGSSRRRGMELPEPISHPGCKKCSYKELCCAFLTEDEKSQLGERSPVLEFAKEYMGRVSPSQIEYVFDWISILEIEEKAQQGENSSTKLWTLSPEQREEGGTCISHVIIGECLGRSDDRHIYKLVRAPHSSQASIRDKLRKNFSQNEYVILSTNARVNVLSGYISSVTESSVDVALDKKVPGHLYFDTFHIDKHSSASLSLTCIANVAGLLSDDPIAERLRKILIDRKPATYSAKPVRDLPASFHRMVEWLNDNQRTAIRKVLRARDYILIKGMPGTGKTQTLVGLVKVLRACGYSVLITAHTHSAVDNLLKKLMRDGVDFLRLGSTHSIDPSVRHKSEKETFAKVKSVQELNDIYESKKIVGVTCLGATHFLLGKRTFDYCIVDESAQILQPVVLRPLYNAGVIVLAGDPEQLPPIVHTNTARRLGADESLFSRLDSKNNTVLLTKQYRMNKSIMEFANKLTYRDCLEMGSDEIKFSTFPAPHIEMLLTREKWIQKALSQNIDESIVVLNTGHTRNLPVPGSLKQKYPECDQIYTNIWEAGITLHLIQSLLQIGVSPSEIGIISPYKSHALFLKKIVEAEVEINTVDQYQGRDKHVIVYTCARSDANDTDKDTRLHLLADHRRLTVALTRAKHKFILVGNKDMMMRYEPFRLFFGIVRDGNVHDLKNDRDDFVWGKVVSLVS